VSSKYIYIILITAVLLTVSEFFPPWLYQDQRSLVYYPAGYHWRFDTPNLSPEQADRLVGRDPHEKAHIIVGDGPAFELPPVLLLAFQDQTRLRGQEILILLAALGSVTLFSRRWLFIALVAPAMIETALVLFLGFIYERFAVRMGGPEFLVLFVPTFIGTACFSIYLLRRASFFDNFWKTYLISVASAALPWLMFLILSATVSVHGTGGYFWVGVMIISLLLAASSVLMFPITLVIIKSLRNTKIS